ncbi:MGMT family protein [Brevundimonas diminuta]|uniref:MGMT family protein n=1 Tax=Brevundimonas diminuta TaxID=293 RepID=UPI00358E456F
MFRRQASPLRPRSGAARQRLPQRAWRALRDTLYGSVLSYGELAKRMEPPTSARAMRSPVHPHLLPQNSVGSRPDDRIQRRPEAKAGAAGA